MSLINVESLFAAPVEAKGAVARWERKSSAPLSADRFIPVRGDATTAAVNASSLLNNENAVPAAMNGDFLASSLFAADDLNSKVLAFKTKVLVYP